MPTPIGPAARWPCRETLRSIDVRFYVHRAIGIDEYAPQADRQESVSSRQRDDSTERCDKNRAQGQEPPLVQGDIFSSLFEKATATTGIDQGAAEGQQLTYRLRFEWREPGAATASVQWTDEVLLRSIEGRWLIDDFIHGGDWQFSVPGSMKRMLRDVARLCISP